MYFLLFLFIFLIFGIYLIVAVPTIILSSIFRIFRINPRRSASAFEREDEPSIRTQQQERQQSSQAGKHFAPDEGEYVDFEEV